jgi:arginyl-tRNA synthetase
VLRQRFATAIATAYPDLSPGTIDPGVTASRNPKFGDFQCNAAMPLAKSLGRPPREVAAEIVRHARLDDLAEPLTPASIAGPGFINITLRADALARMLGALDTPALGLPPAGTSERQTVVVDLCGVNLAKQMHVGHLRATVIGDTLARVLERLGHRVIRQNHVGDWGLPIAMVTARVARLLREGRLSLDTLTLDDLDAHYKAAKRESEPDEAGLRAAERWGMGPKALAELRAQVESARQYEAEGKATLLALQRHDPDTVAIWQRLSDITLRSCLQICRRLNADVRPEHSAGESAYAEDLAPMVEDLVARGVAVEDHGAMVIRLDDQGIAEPCLIRKSDGGFLYATTDLAAIRHRVQRLGAERVIYCVGTPQMLHFRQVFAAAHKAGFTRLTGSTPDHPRDARLEHAAFGSILGEDGKMFKSRSGESVRLAETLDEAEDLALRSVTAKNPDLPEDERARIARAVAVAAIRYADLSSERTKDYVFSFARMLAFEGDTGPYLLYALVRIRSIFRKASERFGPGAMAAALDAPFSPAHPAEKTLALTLTRYPGVVREVEASLEPHRLCHLLYELAGAFSAFFDACPVLAAPDEPTRQGRLRLCALTERVLTDALTTLGIPLIDRM